MKGTTNRQQLPSGKTVVRQLGVDGSLLAETHCHGEDLDIAIAYRFREGGKVEETYFVKGRIASRRTYEKVRGAYKDMPAADSTVEDWGAELLRGMARQRRARKTEGERRRADPDEARKLDAFCTMLLQKGRRDDALRWVQTKGHTLGKRQWSSSKNLVKRLSALGCVGIHVCDIDAYEDGLEHTEHLVVELPAEGESRKPILRAIEQLASEAGYSGDFDDGQRYAYIKLD